MPVNHGVTELELSRHSKPDDLWIAINGKAYDVTQWSRLHPGGQLVLMFLGGKDATDQFKAYHPAWVQPSLKAVEVGPMLSDRPSHSKIDLEFKRLKREVETAGLMQPSLLPYLRLLCFVIILFAGSVYLACHGYLLASALVLALFWQQIAFVGHDLGHSAVAHSARTHALLGLLTNAFLGIGMSWWKSTHNVHHTVVNTADSDPDIQFMPLLAVSDHFFEGMWSRYHQDQLQFDWLAKRLISWQHLTFLPLLMIAKFGLYLQTIKQLMNGKSFISRPSEIAAQLFFFAWYASMVRCFPSFQQRLGFVLLSHAAFFVLHLQICLSHFACSTTKNMDETPDSWMVHQVEGTMNWSCPVWMDWFHGGLQFQIEHHLFPRMPRQNLRAASKYVRPACQRCGLRYHSPGFFRAIIETLEVLYAAAQEARKKSANSSCSTIDVQKDLLLSRAFI